MTQEINTPLISAKDNSELSRRLFTNIQYSSSVFSKLVEILQWPNNFSSSYTPITVWVLPTSITKIIAIPSPKLYPVLSFPTVCRLPVHVCTQTGTCTGRRKRESE